MKQYFGIDIGGTAVKLGIVDETGRVLLKGEESVSFDGYQTPVLTTVRRAAKEFLTANSIPVESLAGIGVSATGQIDSRKGIVAGTCGNFPNYIGSPIKAALEEDFGLPVTVANDANCMTLGEVWVGAAQGYTDVIGVTLGTGVGGGILTGGHLLEGARGLGGELGHYRTHALDGVDCTCGAKGCWERYAATTALVRAAQEKNPDWKDGRAIFAAAEAGNETVLALLDALDGRDRTGPCRHGAHLQPAAHSDRRRRERAAETADRTHCRKGESIGHARLCRGAGSARRSAAQRCRYGGRSVLLPTDHGKGVIIYENTYPLSG